MDSHTPKKPPYVATALYGIKFFFFFTKSSLIFSFGMDQEEIASEMLELAIYIFQDEQVWTEKQD